MFGRGVAKGMARPAGAPLAALHPWLARADLRIANLEGPLTVAPRVSYGPYDLQGSPTAAPVLVAAGFDAVGVLGWLDVHVGAFEPASEIDWPAEMVAVGLWEEVAGGWQLTKTPAAGNAEIAHAA